MLHQGLKALLLRQQSFRTWVGGSVKRLWLTEVLIAEVCAGVRNRGCEDWAGGMQGETAGALKVGEGGRAGAGKKGTKGKEGRYSQTRTCTQGHVLEMFLQQKSTFSSP